MPLKLFATKDAVPADAQADAIETKDGQWAIVEDADTSELATQLAAETVKREAAEKLMRKAQSEAQKATTAKKAADAGMTAERLEELRAEAKAEVLAELRPQLDRATTVEAQNRTLLLDADMKSRALKAGVLPAKVDDWWKLRGGEYDLTADGKPMVKDKPGVNPDTHLAALLKMNPEWVQGTKATGSNATGSSTAGAATISVEDAMRNPSALFSAANAG